MTDHVANADVIMAKVETAEWMLWREQVEEYRQYMKDNDGTDELEEELLDMIYCADDRLEELFEELRDW